MDDCDTNRCNVCREPLRWGERHQSCGKLVMAAERAAKALAQPPEAMKCIHPSWEPAKDGTGRNRCSVCGVLGNERRYLHVEGEPSPIGNMTFEGFCEFLNVTPDERMKLARHLATLRVEATLKLGQVPGGVNACQRCGGRRWVGDAWENEPCPGCAAGVAVPLKGEREA